MNSISPQSRARIPWRKPDVKTSFILSAEGLMQLHRAQLERLVADLILIMDWLDGDVDREPDDLGGMDGPNRGELKAGDPDDAEDDDPKEPDGDDEPDQKGFSNPDCDNARQLDGMPRAITPYGNLCSVAQVEP